MVTGDGYGKSLFSSFSLSFAFWGMVTGDGYGKFLFSSFWGMVTGSQLPSVQYWYEPDQKVLKKMV